MRSVCAVEHCLAPFSELYAARRLIATLGVQVAYSSQEEVVVEVEVDRSLGSFPTPILREEYGIYVRNVPHVEYTFLTQNMWGFWARASPGCCGRFPLSLRIDIRMSSISSFIPLYASDSEDEDEGEGDTLSEIGPGGTLLIF